jgi:aldose 1-epimerase
MERNRIGSDRGIAAEIVAQGATIASLFVPDRDGARENVVLQGSRVIGRYANRIAGASFSLDGRTYTLAANDGANTLHGGPEGFDKAVWQIAESKAFPGVWM